MSRKNGDIETHSVDDLRAAGRVGSDWTRAALAAVPDGTDPDDAMEAVDWLTTTLPMPRRKAHMNLRIDADVVDFFRSQGRGYQTKINAVLRSYVDQMDRR